MMSSGVFWLADVNTGPVDRRVLLFDVCQRLLGASKVTLFDQDLHVARGLCAEPRSEVAGLKHFDPCVVQSSGDCGGHQIVGGSGQEGWIILIGSHGRH